MVSAVRQRRSRYRYARRRGPRQSTILGIVVLLAAAGAAVLVIATRNQGGGSSDATAATGTTHSSGGSTATHRPRRTTAAERRAAADSRLVSTGLRRSSFITAGTRGRRAIALTFDDGPGPYTPAILRILVRMHAPATFFIVGQELTDFAGAIRSELRDGYDIGDHTENHTWLAHLNVAGQLNQIRTAAVRLQRLGAPAPRLFRPPYGAFNATTVRLLRRMRMMMVLWSVDPGDWRRPGAGAIVVNVLSHARPGAVVIMHDGGGDRSQTVAALPAIINDLRKRHYDLVSVPRLLALDPPPRGGTPPRLSGV
jgi:peptidoglycan-N-acetylglucosamine deacetylase